MGQTLTEIAQQLRGSSKKVQLLYAFNGVGKTRLSREFKELVSPKDSEDTDNTEDKAKVIYYNAFTEDLFYWDNDLQGDIERKLKIQPNTYTQWVLKEQGKDQSAITHFQRYTSDKLTPKFSQDFSEVSFSIMSGDDDTKEYIKISKGEESNFIWSIFYSLIEQIIDVLNVVEASERETDQFNKLEYIFIDDPVSSLDDNHLIELAVNTAELIKSNSSELKFIITTHNPLFYNILHNELSNKGENYRGQKDFKTYRLEKMENGTTKLVDQPNDSPFSYHLYLFSVLKKSIETGDIQKYHFSFLRNILVASPHGALDRICKK